jgi:hypothetical protein
MQEPAPPGGREWPISFISNRPLRVVDTDNRDTDGRPAAAPEMPYLTSKIADHPIDLFDHRFGKDLDLDPDFNRRGWAASHEITCLRSRRFTRYEFAERAVTPPGHYSAAGIADIDHAVLSENRGIDELRGSVDRDKVFEKVVATKSPWFEERWRYILPSKTRRNSFNRRNSTVGGVSNEKNLSLGRANRSILPGSGSHSLPCDLEVDRFDLVGDGISACHHSSHGCGTRSGKRIKHRIAGERKQLD